MGTVPIPTTPFEDLAAELAASPGLIVALLTEHRDDGTGHCRSCTTTPGYGSRDVAMPCSLRQLTEYAARLYPGAGGRMSRDEYPARHDIGKPPTSLLAHHSLVVLATGQVLAGRVAATRSVTIDAAMGLEPEVAAGLRSWADGQHEHCGAAAHEEVYAELPADADRRPGPEIGHGVAESFEVGKGRDQR